VTIINIYLAYEQGGAAYSQLTNAFEGKYINHTTKANGTVTSSLTAWCRTCQKSRPNRPIHL